MTDGRTLSLDGTALDIMVLNEKGYCCSQIMTILMLRSLGRENPDLVRAAGGLCNGLGFSGDTCGILSGGLCLISLHAGKGSDDETAQGSLPVMLFKLVEWFRERTLHPYGSMKCKDILALSPNKRACVELMADTYEKVISILDSYQLLGREDKNE